MNELDLKTKLYLKATGANIVDHPKVGEISKKLQLLEDNSKTRDVFVFDNYDEYKKYFLMYLDDIDETVIDLAIYTISKNGQVIALKGLCEKIIDELTFEDNVKLTLTN